MKHKKVPDQLLRKSTLDSIVKCDPYTRRMFLKTAGGALLAIPFFPSLLARNLANAATNAPGIQRYVQIQTANGGVTMAQWMGNNFPASSFQLYSGANAYRAKLSTMLDGNGNFSPILSNSFAGLWDQMNVVLGADIPWYIAHNRCAGTGASGQYRSGQVAMADGEYGGGPFAFDYVEEYPSIDQVIGNFNGGNGLYTNGLGGRRQFVNIGTDSLSCSWGRSVYSDQSLPVEGLSVLGSPSGVFSYLFGTGTITPSTFYASVVDQFWSTGKSLLSKLSSEDQNSLNEVFQLASQAQQDFSVAGPSSCGTVSAPAGTTASQVAGSATAYNNQWSGDASSANALADIIALAFKCDMTRIVTVRLDESFVGSIPLDWHAASHLMSTNMASAAATLVPIHQLVSEQFIARLAQSLNTLQENGQSVLSNSLIYWSLENRVPHDTINLPNLLIGGAGGRIQTGYITDLRDKSRPSFADAYGEVWQRGDHYNRMYASIFYALNVPRTEYEMAHGYNSSGQAVGTNLGYGQLIQAPAGWEYNNSFNPVATDYNLALIGEPWPFMTINGTQWGNEILTGSIS